MKHHSEVKDFSDEIDVSLGGEIIEFDKHSHQAIRKHIFDPAKSTSLDYAKHMPALNHLKEVHTSLDGIVLTVPLNKGSYYVVIVRQARIFNGKPDADRYDLSDLYRGGAYAFNVFFKVSEVVDPSRVQLFRLAAFSASLLVLLIARLSSSSAFSKPHFLVSNGLALVTLAYTCPIQLSPDKEAIRYAAYRGSIQASSSSK